MKKLIFTAILLTLVGCATERLEKQWVGKNASELIIKLGSPSQIQFAGLADKIYVYTELKEQTSKQPEPNEPAKIQDKTKATLFWIDRKGFITKVTQQSVNLSPNK